MRSTLFLGTPPHQRKFRSWPLAAQGEPISVEATQLAEPIPRTFAEFPFNKSWQEIAIHAQRLDGATHVGLFGDDHEQTWIRFVYDSQDFCIQDGGARLTLSVDNSACPDEALHEVQRHFVPLFCPDLSE